MPLDAMVCYASGPRAVSEQGQAFLTGFTHCAMDHGLRYFRPQEIANTAAALANLHYRPEPVFWDSLLEAVGYNCGHFLPADLAMTLHGLARLKDDLPGDFLRRYEEAIITSSSHGK